MMILDKLTKATRIRVERQKKLKPLTEIKNQALARKNTKPFLFEKMLKQKNISFICEVKKASPSKGIIAKDFPYLQIAKEYEKAGASAISVLTEQEFFLGRDEYLQKIARTVSIPVLRKDFTIDVYQIYEAALLGASAVLLICALLSQEDLVEFSQVADKLGLSSIFEAHNEDEIKKALAAKARIIGVNNRDLRDFSVNINNSIKLRQYAPDDVIFISESGIKTAADIAQLRQNKVQAVLIGETFMRSHNKLDELIKLYGTVQLPKIKICGISRKADIEVINAVQPDYIGFVFADSKRKVSAKQANELKKLLLPSIKTVGVFVDAEISEIVDTVNIVGLDVVQLHGDEKDIVIEEIKKRTKCAVWKAVRIKDEKDVIKHQYTKADMLLFDTFSTQQAGGTGISFDWSALAAVKQPFILAGGLCSQNIARAIRQNSPWGVDLNSGLETDGKKDAAKIKETMSIIRRLR